ncbi:MAG: aminotransferase class V-fold PLP-dependent enzyme [Gemmatimonadota bacterium]
MHLSQCRVGCVDAAPRGRRFESSTMAYGATVGLGRSIEYLGSLGWSRVFAHGMALADRLAAGLFELGASIVSPRLPNAKSPIVSARFPGREPRAVVAHLGRAGIVVSARRDGVRFSPHVYNTETDIDQVIATLRELR